MRDLFGETSGAILDPTETYRYRLWRVWDPELPRVTFVMLNPSTADDQIDDPTIRRCLRFARRLGAGRIDVVNLFAYRATNPRDLGFIMDPVGPENDRHVLDACASSRVIAAWGAGVRAWGAWGPFENRTKQVLDLLSPMPIYCLGKTKAGDPRHPLYLAATTKLQELTIE